MSEGDEIQTDMKVKQFGPGRRSIGFNELVKQVQEQKDTKFDVVLPTEKMKAIVSMIPTEQPKENEIEISLTPAVRLEMELPNGHGVQALGLTEHAHGQLAEKCGIPQQYYRKMLEAGKADLVVHNVNEWLGDRDTRMVRMLGGQVRAILSEKYFRLDNYIIATETFNKMEEHRLDWRDPNVVQSCHLTDTRMYIRIVVPTVEREIKVGDIVRQGLIISNSEVGAGSFKAEPFIHRLICNNGMISNEALSRRHLGAKQAIGELDADIYSDKTRELEMETIISQIKDIIENTFDVDFFQKWTDALIRSTEVELGSATEAVDNFCKMYSMKHQAQSLLDRLVAEGDNSQYGLVNAITRQAQEVETIDRQIELERIAGEISMMPEAEFRRKISPVAMVV